MALQVVINALARLIRWSPIYKPVLLRIDEAPDATLYNCQFAGRLVILNPDGSAVIELQRPLSINNRNIERVVAVPRHQSYGFDYLWWGFIAVNLLEQNGMLFAIASLKIGKYLSSVGAH